MAAAGPAVASSPGPTVYVGLKRPEAAARRAFESVSQPGSGGYRDFLPLESISSQFGASAATRASLKRSAKRLGLRARVDPSGVFARLSGPLPRLQRAIGARIHKVYSQEALGYYFFVPASARLHLAKALRPSVREVVPLFDRSGKPPAPGSATVPGSPKRAKPANAGTWLDGCAAAQETGAYSPAQARHAYGLDPIGTGQGGSVAIFNTGETVSREELAAGARCFSLPRLATRTLRTDGQARPFHPESPEPGLDVTMVRGIAPGLSSLTFPQTWLEPKLWFLGASELLDTPRLPDTFSISYGICEKEIRGPRASRFARDSAVLMDALLLRLGLAGVGTFASAGDFGSTCNGKPFSGVTWPASSPYVTAVGGTRLSVNADNERIGEVTWNDQPWLSHEEGGGAGGGGLSLASPRPFYQRNLTIHGDRRAVPDISAHASTLPGWPVMLGDDWMQDGGTSASAPLLAGAFAVLSAGQRAAGAPPLGPVNGLLYYLEERDPAAFFDIVSGGNGYSPKVPPRRAGPGYDLATGIGVPRFDLLAAALPPPG